MYEDEKFPPANESPRISERLKKARAEVEALEREELPQETDLSFIERFSSQIASQGRLYPAYTLYELARLVSIVRCRIAELIQVKKQRDVYKELIEHILENDGQMCEPTEDPSVGIYWCYLCHPDGPL